MIAPGLLKSEEKRAGSRLSMASGAAILGGVFLLLQAWCLAKAVDGVLFGSATLSDVWPWIAGGIAAAAAKSFLSYLTDRWGFAAAAAIKHDLRRRIFSAAADLGPARMGRDAAGRIVTVWMENVEALNNYYARYIPARVQTAVLPLAILLIVYPVDWLSGIILTVTAPLVPFFMIMIGKDTERFNRRQWKRLHFMAGYLLDLLQGMRTVRLFQAGGREARMVRRVSEDYRLETMKVLSVAFLSSLALEFLATASIALVAVIVGFRLFWGEMDFLRGFFVLLLAPEFFLPLRRMGVFYHVRLEAVTAAENIANFLSSAARSAAAGGIVTASGQAPEIVFDDVHFSYGDGAEALKGVSFKIPAGSRAALVGPSGAGKTTVMSLLLGFIHPASGRILVDGQDIGTLDMAAWRRRIGWVPQHPHLFAGSLRDNICLGMPDADLAGVCRALHVDDIAAAVPGGYDGAAGEKAARLSGGQAQRVALARAFVRPADLFMLDEPSARLDGKTEGAIQSAIGDMTLGKTVVVAAHRLKTIAAMDQIIVLESGRVAAAGTHDALLSAHEGYRRAVSC